MNSIVYVVMSIPIFLSIGVACYTVLIQRYQLLAIGVMVFNIFACMNFMENYYNNHEPAQNQKQTVTISCVEKNGDKLICQR